MSITYTPDAERARQVAERARQAAENAANSLEKLAAFIRANPDLNDVDDVGNQRLLVCLASSKDPKTTMAAFTRRALKAGAKVTKDIGEQYAGVDLLFGTMQLHVYATRDQVCERIVVGTHEETIEEKDPELLAQVPTVTTTRTVEDVEWRCTPILSTTRPANSGDTDDAVAGVA